MAESALRSILARFGVQFDDRQLRRGTTSINSAITGLRNFAGAIGGAVLVRGIGRFVGETIRMGDALDKTSQQLGLTANDFEGLSFAAGLAGVDAAAFGNGLGQLQRQALAAQQGSTAVAEAFASIGVEVEDSEGNLRSGNDLLMDMADGLANIDNENERVGLSMQLMGRSGRRLLPMLNQGAEAMRAQAEEGRRLTGDQTEFVAVSVELTDTLFRFNRSLHGLRARIAVVLLPIIERSVRTMTRWAVTIRELTEDSHIWQIALAGIGVAAVALGIKLTLAFAGPLVTIGLLAAALLIIGLIVDDVWVAFEGGDSVLSGLADELLAAIGVWWRFEHVVREVHQAVQDLWEFLQAAGQFFVGIFGGGPEGPAQDRGSMVRGGFSAGRSVRELFSPSEAGEGAAFRREEARRRGARDRTTRRRAAAALREEQGPQEGDLRSGRVLTGEGGRIIGRAPAQAYRGGQWVTVGETSVEVNVQTASTDPEEVGRIVRRETTATLERERRQTLAALEGAST